MRALDAGIVFRGRKEDEMNRRFHLLWGSTVFVVFIAVSPSLSPVAAGARLDLSGRSWQSLGKAINDTAIVHWPSALVLDIAAVDLSPTGSKAIAVYAACGKSGLLYTTFKRAPTGSVSVLPWNRVDGALGDIDIRSVLACGDTLFAGSADEGVFRNAGKWEVFSNGLPAASTLGRFLPITRLVREEDLLFAASSTGQLYRSPLSASPWENVDTVYAAQLARYHFGDSLKVPHEVFSHFFASSYGFRPAQDPLAEPVPVPLSITSYPTWSIESVAFANR
jgi:hypothetical protein